MPKLPPIDPHPKPKSKGKKPAPPKIKTSPTVDPLDVFKVALDADAGSESSGNARQAFNAMLHALNKPQLGRLEKLVQRVRKNALKDKKRQATCDKVSKAIGKRHDLSAETEVALQLEVQKKLKKLSISSIERTPSGKVKQVRLKKKLMTLPALIKEQFRKELEAVEKGLKKGTLIRHRYRQRAENFLERILRSAIDSSL